MFTNKAGAKTIVLAEVMISTLHTCLRRELQCGQKRAQNL